MTGINLFSFLFFPSLPSFCPLSPLYPSGNWNDPNHVSPVEWGDDDLSGAIAAGWGGKESTTTRTPTSVGRQWGGGGGGGGGGVSSNDGWNTVTSKHAVCVCVCVRVLSYTYRKNLQNMVYDSLPCLVMATMKGFTPSPFSHWLGSFASTCTCSA